MNSESPWEVLPLEGPILASKWHKFHIQFCFGHNFWSDAYFSIPFSLVIYIYPARCMETNIDHILWPFQTKPEWLFWVILAIFNNLAMIAWLDMALNMVHVVFYASSRINVHQQWKRNWKICIGSNVMAKKKIGCQILAISFVFLALLRPKMAIPVAIVPDHLESWNFFWCLIWPILMGKCCELNQIQKFVFLNPPNLQAKLTPTQIW